MAAALELRNLTVTLETRRGRFDAVRELSLAVEPGETLAIVGESGCGKSLTALAAMRLLPWPPARLGGGEIRLMGRDVADLPESAMQDLRGREISMIFQDPMSALNPVLTIGSQIEEAIRRHRSVSRAEARRIAIELLRKVRIPDAERRFDNYPHQLSGGMSQRVVIAMAIACGPKILIADEPTTALDVTIQAQILSLLKELQRESGLAIVLITHDLGVVAEAADRVAVMYAGRKVEEASVEGLFARPRHPYTRGLLGATPSTASGRQTRLTEIGGVVPVLADLPPGCPFQNRCPVSFARCRAQIPELRRSGTHSVACFVAEEEWDIHVAPVLA